MAIERKQVKRKKVTVIFRYEGLTYPNDIMPGILLEDGMVFVANEGLGVYEAELLPSDNFVLVDLDTNGKNLIEGDDNAIMELVLGGGDI